MEYEDKNKEYKIGDTYFKKNGCPACGSDLEVTEGIAVICINFQHPHVDYMYNKNGNRSCDYALMYG